MTIKPSAELRNNYRKVADFCIETGEPVFLTNNGEGELVVMSIAAWEAAQLRMEAEPPAENEYHSFESWAQAKDWLNA